MHSGYSMLTNCSFDSAKNKLDVAEVRLYEKIL